MFVVSPAAEHVACTVILLHGFSSNADEMHAKIHGFFPDWFARNARFVYLTAPLRRITCYSDGWYRSWHDYFTQYGDVGVAAEEVIDVDHLRQTRAFLHDVVRNESRARPGVPVFLLGESQGGCCALDAFLTSELDALSGVIVSYAMRYSATPMPSFKRDAPVWFFHSRADGVIPYALAKRSLEGLRAHSVVVDRLPHASVGRAFESFLHVALTTLVGSTKKSRRATNYVVVR